MSIYSSMTTDEDLWKLATRFDIPINDICFKDLLNDKPPKHGVYIINLADNTENGSHWVACWLDKPKHCAYFDSFGVSCALVVEEFARRWCCHKIIMSNVDSQSINSGGCGQYSLNFLAFMSRHPKIDLEKRYRMFLSQFHSPP